MTCEAPHASPSDVPVHGATRGTWPTLSPRAGGAHAAGASGRGQAGGVRPGRRRVGAYRVDEGAPNNVARQVPPTAGSENSARLLELSGGCRASSGVFGQFRQRCQTSCTMVETTILHVCATCSDTCDNSGTRPEPYRQLLGPAELPLGNFLSNLFGSGAVLQRQSGVRGCPWRRPSTGLHRRRLGQCGCMRLLAQRRCRWAASAASRCGAVVISGARPSRAWSRAQSRQRVGCGVPQFVPGCGPGGARAVKTREEGHRYATAVHREWLHMSAKRVGAALRQTVAACSAHHSDLPMDLHGGAPRNPPGAQKRGANPA